MHGYNQHRFYMGHGDQVRPPAYFNAPHFQYRASNKQTTRLTTFNNLGRSSSNDHWCETCDRSFPTVDLLEKHVQQHQKCNIDGCQFIAHPKVVTKHIQMQHATGLYKKISNLNNPEDIQKWREERKRKYPTKQNIERKAAECKEKIERGEKMGLKTNKNNRTFKTDTKRKYGFNEDRHQKRQRINTKNCSSTKHVKKYVLPKKIEEVLPTANILRSLKPFAGIQDIIMEYTAEGTEEEVGVNLDIEDDDDVHNLKDEVDKTGPKVCSALSALICDYESPDEQFEEVELQNNTFSKFIHKKNDVTTNCALEKKCVELTTTKSDNQDNNVNKGSSEKKCVEVTTTRSDNQDNNSIICLDKVNHEIAHTENTVISLTNLHNQEDYGDEEGPEEVKLLKNNDQVNAVSLKNSKTTKKVHANNFKIKRYQYTKPKLPSTLLQKLLYGEIQQERNIVLQCVRYIMKNNFFDSHKISAIAQENC